LRRPAAFLCICAPQKGCVFMAMTTRMMIYAFLLYGGIFASIVAVIARVIKYLIRYGIDYYFEKLKEHQKD
jgi:hypothetical protein